MSDGGAKRYLFVTGPNPCDICDGMEGEYDYQPHVPVHPHCQCTVSEIEAEEAECDYEIRNLEIWEETYTESEEMPYKNAGTNDATTDIEIDLEVVESSYDEGVEEAVEWSPQYGSNSGSVVIPAQSEGEIVLEVEYTQMVCSGELWKVCATPDPVAGVHTKETLVGNVGGMAIARTALVGLSVDDTPAIDDSPSWGDPYISDDDEIPV